MVLEKSCKPAINNIAYTDYLVS